MCLGDYKKIMMMTDWLTEWERLSCSKNRQDETSLDKIEHDGNKKI